MTKFEQTDTRKALKEKVEALKDMSAYDLLIAYNRVRDLNMGKKTLGYGEDSGIYEQACYKEILRRMEA